MTPAINATFTDGMKKGRKYAHNPPINHETIPGQYTPFFLSSFLLDTKKYSLIITPAAGATKAAKIPRKSIKYCIIPNNDRVVPTTAAIKVHQNLLQPNTFVSANPAL